MAAAQAPAKYIISRYGDPVFALFIGFSAALLRIRKEETEKRLGVPSSSMIISPAQQKRIDDEQEKRRQMRTAPSEMYGPKDYGSSETYGGRKGPQEGISTQEKTMEVSYRDVLRLGWERIKWKADYEWHGRAKELQRKDGRLV